LATGLALAARDGAERVEPARDGREEALLGLHVGGDQPDRRAIETAKTSIETMASTRRTLAWLNTSLLKGMSREDDRVVFCTAAAIRFRGLLRGPQA
jgi:hypothetical protein